MRLKPKSTTLNKRALCYKRFTALENSATTNYGYRTQDGLLWAFDSQTLQFYEPFNVALKVITQVTANSRLKYGTHLFKYDNGWQLDTLNLTFNNIAKYQTNKYYFVGTFDFMLRGSIDGETTQVIRGNIVPLETLTIKHFNDYIKLCPDDLVVINGKLYSVENVSEDHKHQPKDYKIYYATLNSVL